MAILKKKKKSLQIPPYFLKTLHRFLYVVTVEDHLDNTLLNVNQDLYTVYFDFNGTRDF